MKKEKTIIKEKEVNATETVSKKNPDLLDLIDQEEQERLKIKDIDVEL